MKFKANNYKTSEVVKFIRENSGKNQTDFAHSLDKSSNWLKAIEQGINRIYFDDILKIVNMYDIDIIIKDKNQ